MTQDTLQVVALYKALRDKYKSDGKDKSKPHIRCWKLFSRHIEIKEQQDALNADCKEQENLVNVYIGTPNRIKELAKNEAIRLDSKKFKIIVLDCALNKKNRTMLETNETRDDAFGTLAHTTPLLLKRKLKVYLSK